MGRLKYLIIAILFSLAIPLATAAAPVNRDHPAITTNALSGQCYYNYQGQPLWEDSYTEVNVDMDLSCTVSHTRQIQTCLYTETTSGTNYTEQACYTSGAYSAKYWYGEVDRYAVTASSHYLWRQWYWMYDYSTGETWDGWGYWYNLGVAPG